MKFNIYLSNIFIFDVMKSSNYIIFSLILITSILSCEKSERPDNCNCGTVIELTTGENGPNPFPTDCDGIYDNYDNYTISVRNNCTNNIKVFCNYNMWSGAVVGYEWCNYNSTEAW